MGVVDCFGVVEPSENWEIIFMDKLQCLRPIVIVALFFLAINQNQASGGTAEQIRSRGIVLSLKEYCAGLNLGQVRSQIAIDALENAEERKICERELTKARQTLKDIALFCRYLRKPDLSVQEKTQSLESLANLRARVLSRGPNGVGNLELACALSMLSCGVFFDVYSAADETAKNSALRAFDMKEEVSIALVRDALRADLFASTNDNDHSVQSDEVINLVFGGNEERQDSVETARSTLDVLAKELQGRIAKASLADQLAKPDSKWLAWDLIWAFRLHALCRLSLYVPRVRPDQGDAARRQYEVFQSAITNQLSTSQQRAIWAISPSTSSAMKKNARVLLEIQEHVNDKGQHILEMLSRRLDGAE